MTNMEHYVSSQQAASLHFFFAPLRLCVKLLFLCLSGAILLSACTGLAGEPRIVSTLPPRPTEAPLTLDTAELDRNQGAVIFAERCADCHGINGEGGTQILNGQTLENMPDFTDAATIADHTLEDYYTIITSGLLDEGKLMPGFASLTDDERAAVAYYVYSLNEFPADSNAVPAPVSTEEAAASPEIETTPNALPQTDLTATVTGQIQHSRPDVTLPDELQVSLILVNIATFEQTLINGTTDAAGTYQFTDVPLSTQFAYLVRVLYEDRIFSSLPVRGDETSPTIDIPVTIYETTSDPAVIIGQFVSMRILPGTGTLQGLQVMGFTNTSPDVFMTDNQIGEDTYASLTLPLPFRNVLLNTPDTENRFVPTDDGLSVYDTQPVFPGTEYIAQLPFEFPHEDRTTVDFVMDYALSGTFEIFVARPLQIENPDMTIAETFTDEQTGLTFDIYTTALELAAGERFTYTIAGDTALAADPASITTDTQALPGQVSTDVLLVIFVAGLFFVGMLIISLVRMSANSSEDIDPISDRKTQLIEQIAALDSRYQSGDLAENDYQTLRERLKTELITIMADNTPQ